MNTITRFKDGRFTNTDLSTGQRKRLAFIAAILEDKPILILDEFAADQDPVFRKYFYEDILKELKLMGKTVIAVTHDDHYFHIPDRLLKMDSGNLLKFSSEK
jgi:putative pyoverdin transport system ATP-binding/permease protein